MDQSITTAQPSNHSAGRSLFELYAAGVGGTTHDGATLTWEMVQPRQRRGWETAAALFTQGLRTAEDGGNLMLPDQALVARMTGMLQNQLELNSKAYSTTWLEKGKTRQWIYPVAASQEIGEFLNSAWEPWWSKEHTVDMANCRIELVDALHFMMSELLIAFDGDVDSAAISMAMSYEECEEACLEDPVGREETIGLARTLQVLLNSFEPTDDIQSLGMAHLFCLAQSIGFSLGSFEALYYGKSVLNQFRRDNGYKEGRYTKMWDGKREDNYFLARWITKLCGEGDPAPTKEEIRTWLQEQYEQHVDGFKKAIDHHRV